MIFDANLGQYQLSNELGNLCSDQSLTYLIESVDVINLQKSVGRREEKLTRFRKIKSLSRIGSSYDTLDGTLDQLAKEQIKFRPRTARHWRLCRSIHGHYTTVGLADKHRDATLPVLDVDLVSKTVLEGELWPS